MKTLLELFSGSGNMSAAFRAKGWHTITLDNDPRCTPDITMDILRFDPTEHLPSGTKVDAIWASPCCQWYSTARNWKPATPEELEYADSLVRKVLQIASELKCELIFVENPSGGKLKDRGILDDLQVQEVHYCKYGMDFMRPTNIWTTSDWTPKQTLCHHDCPATIVSPNPRYKRHRVMLGKKNKGSRLKIAQIPPLLCAEIADFCDGEVLG